MDNSANQQNSHTEGGARPADETTSEHGKPPQLEGCVLASLCSAMRKGAEEARTAAEKAVPKLKSAAADVVFWAAYGVSFAAVFQWTLARNLAPQSMKAGCRNGAKAGREAAERLAEKLRHCKDQATATSPDQTGPGAEAIQPGAG
jgi:hypothetical protein